MKTVILINGKARSGKDTVARMMKRYLESDRPAGRLVTRIHSFAQPLKEVVAKTFNISLENLEDYKNRSSRFSVSINDNDNPIYETNMRVILQRFGTEAMKPIFGDNVWAKLLADKVLEQNAEVFIIPDFRFTIEYDEFVKLVKADKIHLYVFKVQSDMQNISDSSHSSETELDSFGFDYVIDNNKGELRFTEEQIQNILEEIL